MHIEWGGVLVGLLVIAHVAACLWIGYKISDML